MALSTDEKVRWMSHVQLFRGVPPEALKRLADLLGEIDFAAGQHMLTQGHVGSGLYILVTGKARIQRGDEVIADLGPADIVGEMAVLDQQPRGATVIATEPVTALALASWDMIAELDRDPQLALNLLRELAGRVRFLEERYVH